MDLDKKMVNIILGIVEGYIRVSEKSLRDYKIRNEEHDDNRYKEQIQRAEIKIDCFKHMKSRVLGVIDSKGKIKETYGDSKNISSDKN